LERIISSYRDRERGHSFDKADRCKHYRSHAKEREESSDDYYDEVSKEGKTRTSTWRGKNAEGKDVHNVVVFDKP
jgi:hypothetical protein